MLTRVIIIYAFASLALHTAATGPAEISNPSKGTLNNLQATSTEVSGDLKVASTELRGDLKATSPELRGQAQNKQRRRGEGVLKSFDLEEGNTKSGKGRFNDSLANSEAVLETVARMDTHHHHHHRKNASGTAENEANTPGNRTEESSANGEEEEDEIPRLIDANNNEYVMTKPHKGIGQMELKEDFALISDLVQVIVAAALGGLLFGLLRQPVILGYLVAGSIVGPGGLGLIDELVQVETLAQFGVVFLLFVLGVEFSAAKVYKVKEVAIGGGILQMVLSMLMGIGISALLGAPLLQGFFVGAFVSMSSTAVVLKCLMDHGSVGSVHGQVMLGTLILQDCALGLLLAVLPSLAEAPTMKQLVLKVLRELGTLTMFVSLAWLASRVVIPPFLRLLSRLSRQTEELFQLGVVAICLMLALLSENLGLSIEVGAFIAGLMLSGPEYSERTLKQVEPVRNIFAALFLASIGMIMHPVFLWEHLDVLLACLALLFFGKTLLTAFVVRLFGYPPGVALSVGIALAQIGEFSFVLLSRAKALGLVPRTLYLLLLGTTALSLCFTPFAFKWVPSRSLSPPTSPPPSRYLPHVLSGWLLEYPSSP
ncbi:hypothetical protein CYMTET_42862 [Cymbomonas tetramitiformis]|uniref:Cation/H+ exchanger transmembrane domain-containing protein n=1 Tax=Cymbomonas tetramitiformis TaxID=36881 RepID=A0AAE0C3B9_9CHLO|nr:hypothetical protein CYMTET_42862 [Cymbomonas tetramitiformis]